MSSSGFNDTDWERYRAFLAVFDSGSLSAAARALNTMQPTVRRRIEALERQLDTALFTRSPNGLEPTTLAHELVAPARAMAAAALAFSRTGSSSANLLSGVVRVTASEVIGVEVLPSLLASLMAEHPELIIELSLDNANADLLHREADIAIRMVRPTQQALVAQRVGDITLGLHARRDLLERHGMPINLDDLSRFPLIGFDTETAGIRSLRTLGLTAQRQDFAYRTDSDVAQLAAIRAGLGIGVCHVSLARRSPDLVQLLPDQVSYPLETWVVMHEDLRRVHRVRHVFRHLAQHLSAYIGMDRAAD